MITEGNTPFALLDPATANAFGPAGGGIERLGERRQVPGFRKYRRPLRLLRDHETPTLVPAIVLPLGAGLLFACDAAAAIALTGQLWSKRQFDDGPGSPQRRAPVPRPAICTLRRSSLPVAGCAAISTPPVGRGGLRQ